MVHTSSRISAYFPRLEASWWLAVDFCLSLSLIIWYLIWLISFRVFFQTFLFSVFTTLPGAVVTLNVYQCNEVRTIGVAYVVDRDVLKGKNNIKNPISDFIKVFFWNESTSINQKYNFNGVVIAGIKFNNRGLYEAWKIVKRTQRLFSCSYG